MVASVPGGNERTRCNACSGVTWHNVIFNKSLGLPLYDRDREGDDAFGEIDERWELLQCLGCDNITLRVTSGYPWAEEEEILFFPERTSGHHQQKHYNKLPPKLKALYDETLTAYNRGSLLLCTAGIRALLEGLCADRGITEGPNEQGKSVKNLEGKINGLASIVPSGIVKNLHGLRFLGNQALHELEIPNKPNLELALTVIEDVLNVVYDLDYKSQVLYETASRAKVAPRTNDEPL
jgi:hypothetical protein